MAVKILYKPNYIKIFDTVLINNLPAAGAVVVVINRKTGLKVASGIIDNSGEYAFLLQKDNLPAGIYDVKYYGCGLKEDYMPEGSWETLEVRDPNLSIAASLHAVPGLVVKLEDGVYTPSSITLNASTYNIFEPTYKWYRDTVLISGETADALVLDTEDELAASVSRAYKCEVNGKNIDGEAIQPMFITTNITKIIDGEPGIAGPGVVYRGVFAIGKTYTCTNIRRDVVYYAGSYYLCNLTHTADAWEPARWDEFGAQFSSIATGLLLAEDAIITKTLTLGEVGNATYGIIKSANAVDIDSGTGFYLSANDTYGLFRVGNATQYIKWNGSALRIKSDYFDLTTGGTLWTSSGGFGGTVESPKIELNSNGLKTGETYIHGTDAWTAPTSTLIVNSNIGTSWDYFGTVNKASNLLTIDYTEINSYVYFTETLSEASVNKIYEFKGFFEGTGETLKKHTYRIDILIDSTIVKTVDGYKHDGASPTPYSVSYTNTASSGELKVKVTYTGTVDQATTLPDLTE